MEDFYPLEVADVRPETDDAICVTFAVPEALKETFGFRPGQFLTLKAEVDGQLVSRAYSICSGIDDKYLQVGIKRVAGGVFSNYANDHFRAGCQVLVLPPQGDFGPRLDPEHHKRYMCLAVGSGITPILSIIKSVLAREPHSQITLIYGNRRSSTVMFREALSFLKNAYLDRFQWINILSREDQGSDLLNGRIDNRKGYLLQKHKLIDIHNTDEAFICGPEAMMSEVSHGFRLEGLTDKQIHYELFAGSSEDSRQRLEKARQRVERYGEGKTSEVTIKADGRAVQFNLATVGENILDAGLRNGLALPHSCKAGVCATCKCRLLEGRVDMDIDHVLDGNEVAAGFILSCQAHPISERVVVDFDQR